MVTAGSNQLLYLLADTLCDPGDIVLCAAPTYYVYLGVLKNLGIRAVSVATDEQGLVPEALAEKLEQFAKAGELGLIPTDQAARVADSYREYRRLQHGLRLNNQPSRVPREQVADMARGVRELWNGVFGDRLEA